MSKISYALLALLFIVSPASAFDLFYDGGGEMLPGGSGRETCWTDEPDYEGWIVTSEQILEFGLESEIANDFLIDAPGSIILARWWGGYYSLPDEFEHLTSLNLRFYEDDDCRPASVILEIIVPGDANETFVQEQYNALIYEYWYPMELDVVPGVTYWFGAQAGDHEFLPQWGRLAATSIQGCESVLWSPYFAFPEWTPVSEVLGEPYDASQEFECGEPVATESTSWGRIRGIYR